MFDAALTPLSLTLKVAASATLLATLFGVAAGLLLSKVRFAGRDIVDALLLLPMVMPPTVLGYYLLVVLVAAAVVAFPLVFKGARTAFDGINPDFENAGRTLGYTEWTLFIRITFPLSWRGVAAGSMLAFARAMGEFGATLMIAGNIPGRTQTLSIAIYEAVNAGDDALANGLVLVASLVCVGLLVAASVVIRRGHLKVEPL